LASTAVFGSRAGTGGISISPAPRLPRLDRDGRELRVLPDRDRLVPVPVLLLPAPLPVPLLPVLPVLPVLADRPEPVAAEAGAALAGAGAFAATPHTSQ
jgi:hypothetical protein